MRKGFSSLGLIVQETLKQLNRVDPQAWLADVLARLPDHPARRLDDLLPWNWTQFRPQPIAA